MLLFIFSFLVAFVVTMLLVWSAARHAHLSGDTDKSQPQKFHSRVVPRIGGVGIMVGVLAGGALAAWNGYGDWAMLGLLTLCGMVAFAAGLIEDLTKRVTPLQRLLATMAAAALAAWLINGVIPRTDLLGLSSILQFSVVAVMLTLVAVAGVANSVNIIDGFNGLASMCVAIMLAAVGYVAFKVGDMFVMHAALITLGAVLGFFVWNYPLGLIFLGDGGAYFLGFWVAELSILLIQRNEAVSPLFPLMVCAYPIFETLFSMYRRKVVRGRPVGQPDAAHLHSLIYRRIMRRLAVAPGVDLPLRRNSMTSPYLWGLCMTTAFPSVVWWGSDSMLGIALVVFCAIYISIYRAIVRFNVPRLAWLSVKLISFGRVSRMTSVDISENERRRLA